MIRYLKNNFNKNKKGISPLIATILLIVVAVAIIAIILNWGRDFTTTHTDDLSDIISPSEFSSGFVNFKLIRNTTFHLENLYKESITITGYMIFSDKGDEDHDLLNIYIDIDPPIEILPNQTAQINLVCIPEREFQVNFRLSDNTYFTKNVTSTSPNINYCDTEYTPPEPLFLCDNSTAGGFFFSGEGTESEPYGICNCQMLQDIDNYLDAHYILLTNIDCSDFGDFTAIGLGDWFEGVLDGDYYTISNLNIVNVLWEHLGFFNQISGGEVKNLNLDSITSITPEYASAGIIAGSLINGGIFSNIHVTNSYVESGEYSGGLIGITSDSTILNSSFNGDVNGIYGAGGLVGSSGGTNIIQSKSSGNIFSLGNEWNQGGEGVGGLAGLFGGAGSKAYILNSYSDANVYNFTDNVGGLVGDLYWNGDINFSYSNAEVSIGSGSDIGGLVGNFGSSSSINNSYWNSDLYPTNNGGGEGKTESELQQLSTFVDWDFTTIWSIDPSKNNGMPYLQWED